MYGLILMAALSAGPDTPGLGEKLKCWWLTHRCRVRPLFGCGLLARLRAKHAGCCLPPACENGPPLGVPPGPLPPDGFLTGGSGPNGVPPYPVPPGYALVPLASLGVTAPNTPAFATTAPDYTVASPSPTTPSATAVPSATVAPPAAISPSSGLPPIPPIPGLPMPRAIPPATGPQPPIPTQPAFTTTPDWLTRPRAKTITRAEAVEAAERRSARVTFRVPTVARLYVDGQPVPGGGPLRLFHTPDLEPGDTFFYEFRAEVEVAGRTVTDRVRVEVRAGDDKAASFPKLDAFAR